MKKTYIRPTSTAVELNLVNMLAASSTESKSNLNWDSGEGTSIGVNEETDNTDLGIIG